MQLFRVLVLILNVFYSDTRAIPLIRTAFKGSGAGAVQSATRSKHLSKFRPSDNEAYHDDGVVRTRPWIKGIERTAAHEHQRNGSGDKSANVAAIKTRNMNTLGSSTVISSEPGDGTSPDRKGESQFIGPALPPAGVALVRRVAFSFVWLLDQFFFLWGFWGVSCLAFWGLGLPIHPLYCCPRCFANAFPTCPRPSTIPCNYYIHAHSDTA